MQTKTTPQNHYNAEKLARTRENWETTFSSFSQKPKMLKNPNTCDRNVRN
jgi:hypothetical protein